MREDFKKLLCERERTFEYWYKEPKGQKKDRQHDESQEYEDWQPGGRSPIKKTFYGRSRKTKQLNENLSPLLGFLKKNIGNSWNKVFSEIKNSCPSEGAVNAHIYQHLFDYVETNAIFRNGVPYTPPHKRFNRYGGFKDEELYRLTAYRPFTQFYVDQKGILRAAPPLQRAKKPKAIRDEIERHLHKDRWAVNMNGIWFWVFLKPIPKSKTVFVPRFEGDTNPTPKEEYPSFSDQYFPFLREKQALPSLAASWFYNSRDGKKLDPYKDYVRVYGSKVYCWKIEQMNSRDIQKYHLNK